MRPVHARSAKFDIAVAVAIFALTFSFQVSTRAQCAVARNGREIFRFDTFGDEQLWTTKLRMHEVIQGVDPTTALGVGLKVDVDALPAEIVTGLRNDTIDLMDPAITVALLKLNAVVGVKGRVNDDNVLTSVGITCALCHSTVDDSLAPGIGHRRDGWANRDLNVGAIVASAPDLTVFVKLLALPEDTIRQVLNSWGPGKFDAELILDGKAFRPDGKTAATLIPSAFGLVGVNNHTWTGSWGTVTYWNAFVANLEMHSQGTFYDPRLDNAEKYPIAAREGFGHKRDKKDLTTAKLPALHFYQLAIPTPKAPAGSYDSEAARHGRELFNNKATCATCHVPPIFTEPGWNLHTAEEIGIDDFQASRAPDNRYRTEPLRALFDTQKIHKGGFYHDGRFATLLDVVNHYDRVFRLGLTETEKSDLVEYLKSI
jgi:cytochrome c5